MSDVAISVKNLSKKYYIGSKQERYKTLRDTLTDVFVTPFRKAGKLLRGQATGAAGLHETIWALKDISFEIKKGEVVGIIGRNGAGKTTLLKILSRITEPTEGYAEIYGRVGSLLEVGTGFHPELTGRENIYLNGAILGMKRMEIDKKFDEIVSFAEVEKFIDTPVKHYSTGMYLRLAFAVAAHLEPEILLVDEVLAVGDAQFQKKCLGKMGEVAKEGRTVLFVSHNMQAIQQLCKTSFQLEAGQIVAFADSQTVVARYLATMGGMNCEVVWPEEKAPGNNEIKLIAVRVSSESGDRNGIYSSRKDIYVEIEFIANTNSSGLCVGFDLVSSRGDVITRSYQTDLSPDEWPKINEGFNRWKCIIPKGLLNAGIYYICPKIGVHSIYWIINLDAVVQFQIVLDHGISHFWNVLDDRNRPGVIAPIFKWTS